MSESVPRDIGMRTRTSAARIAVSVNPVYLQTAFDLIHKAHGSLDGYLEEVLGVDAALRERITARLLD